MRKKILIVNVFFDDFHRTTGSPWRVPRGSGPVFLAGAFNSATTDIRLYSEQTDGYLLDAGLLGWPDMLVLTGLTSGLDRLNCGTASIATSESKSPLHFSNRVISVTARL